MRGEKSLFFFFVPLAQLLAAVQPDRKKSFLPLPISVLTGRPAGKTVGGSQLPPQSPFGKLASESICLVFVTRAALQVE